MSGGDMKLNPRYADTRGENNSIIITSLLADYCIVRSSLYHTQFLNQAKAPIRDPVCLDTESLEGGFSSVVTWEIRS